MKKVSIEEITTSIQYGFTESATAVPVGPKFLRITDIQEGQVNWESVPYCVCPDFEKFKLAKGDIVFARTGATTGKSYLINGCPDAVFASYLIRLRVKEKIYPNYVYYFFQSEKYWSQIRSGITGSTQGGLNATKLSELEIPLPDYKTQIEIAEQLEQADKARHQRKAANALTDQFLQSSFLSLFGDPVKNDKEWEVKTLDDVCDKVTDGEHLSPKLVNKGNYLIMAKDVRENEVDFSQNNFVSNDDFEKFTKKCKPEVGDLLLVSRGATIGRCCIVKTKIPFCLMGSVILIKPKQDSILGEYLKYLFTDENFFEKVIKVSSASAQQAIYISNIKELSAPIPPLSLQQQFAGIVAQAEQLRQKQRESERELENLFQALLQKYFG